MLNRLIRIAVLFCLMSFLVNAEATATEVQADSLQVQSGTQKKSEENGNPVEAEEPASESPKSSPLAHDENPDWIKAGNAGYWSSVVIASAGALIMMIGTIQAFGSSRAGEGNERMEPFMEGLIILAVGGGIYFASPIVMASSLQHRQYVYADHGYDIDSKYKTTVWGMSAGYILLLAIGIPLARTDDGVEAGITLASLGGVLSVATMIVAGTYWKDALTESLEKPAATAVEIQPTYYTIAHPDTGRTQHMLGVTGRF